MAGRRHRRAGLLHGDASIEHPVIRRGRKRVRRRQDGHRAYVRWRDESDYGSSDFDCHNEFSSSSDDTEVFVHPRRKTILEDALFEFFSKEAIKSVKEISQSFVGFPIVKVSGIDKSCFTVYSTKYFFEVLRRLTAAQKSVIQKFGFHCLLVFGKTGIPSPFIRWLASCVDPHSSQIIVDDKILNLSKDSFHFVLGLPNSGAELVDDSDGGLDFILSLFNLLDAPHITFFGDKLKSSEPLSDQEIFVCFMQIAISCFLCPSSSDCLDTRYIKQLGDFEQARNFDVCHVVYKHLIHGITKTLKFVKSNGRKPKAFELCSYGLAVYYLDGLDFGVHIAGSGVPRAISWRGDMIIQFSELDRKSRTVFGRRRLRQDLPRCYLNKTNVSNTNAMHCGTYCDPMSEQQKQALHEEFGFSLSGKTIDGIIDIVQSLNSSQLGNNNLFQSLAHSVLQFLSNARPWYISSNTIPTDTPVAFASNAFTKNWNITALEMQPVVKVKSRLALHLPENCSSGFCQTDLISPIGRMSLSPSCVGKEGSKVAEVPMMDKVLPKTSKGSKKAPITIADTTLKANLVEDSPEVTITKSFSFKDHQKKLALDVDSVYDRTVHQKPSKVCKSKEMAGVSFKAQPEVVENYALVYHGVHCSYISLGQTLMPDGHIDNFLIPCFCQKFFEDNHPSKSGRHYFFSYIGESILQLSNQMHESLVRTSFLGAASASKGKRLDFSDRLFFPICHLEHWFTFVVDFKWKLFAFLDSLYGPKSEYQCAIRGPLIDNFIILWNKIIDTDVPNFKNFQVMTPNMPRQKNAHDCRVFQMKSLEVFDPTKSMLKEFSANDIIHLRIQYANCLFFHNSNKADQSLVRNFFVKEDFVRQLH
ncbi:hypothetical protein ACQ4PT_008815 [Festuca glaucescens]